VHDPRQWGEGHPIRLVTILDSKQQPIIAAFLTEQVGKSWTGGSALAPRSCFGHCFHIIA
jgi:hypothetical protein